MAIQLDFLAAKVAPTGGLSGDFFSKALGTPELSTWEVLFRESFQNSWDARIGEKITYKVQSRLMSEAQLDALRLALAPPDMPGVAQLNVVLGRSDVRVLSITDQGTVGLAGPTRPDRTAAEGESVNFRSFVFSVGRDPDRPVAGGTYGIGKVAHFLSSEARTCVIYSQIKVGEAIVPRIIVSTIGSSYSHGGVRYEGRHWWGVRDGDAIGPVEGHAARALAEDLGIATLGQDDTGTTIAILAPIKSRTGGDSDNPDTDVDRVALMRRASIKWAWPHIAGRQSGPTIDFHFERDGIELPPPSLAEDPELWLYVDAYREAEAALHETGASGNWQVKINSLPLKKTARRAGVLATRRELDIPVAEPKYRNTVALMRDPRTVVEYKSVPADPHGPYIAGVFIAEPDRDADFARQEPVTHDSWTPEQIESGRRNPSDHPVWATLRDFVTIFRPAGADTNAPNEEQALGGAVVLARRLGEGLPAGRGSGAELTEDNPSRRHRAKVSPLAVRHGGDPIWISSGDRVIVDFPFALTANAGEEAKDWTISADADVALESGASEHADEFDSIEIVGWLPEGTTEPIAMRQAPVAMFPTRKGAVRVSHPPSLAVMVSFRKQAG